MDVVHDRCAGLDVSKRDAKVCVRVQSPTNTRATSTVTTWSAMTNSILELREHLVKEKVTLVVMEATSDYWKPFFYLLEDGPFEVMLVNPRHVKNLPGRKTDVSDSAWLADLRAHGLVRGSFVPPEPIRQLRDLTRARSAIIRERAREVQRLEKFLEDAGIKLTSVATDLTGVSGRAMLDALVEGERDPVVLAGLAKRRLRTKIPELIEALTGRFNDHHAFLVRIHLDALDEHTKSIDEITNQIEVAMVPFASARELLVTIPGVSHSVADVIIAETGADMSRFPSPGHLASWAGTCPGSNESAGRVKSTHTRPGDPYLKGALGIAALAATRQKDTFYSARYRRLASRRGPMKALVAIEHSILVAPSGTCSRTAPTTAISARTTTPSATPIARRGERAINYETWAMPLPWNQHLRRRDRRHLLGHVNQSSCQTQVASKRLMSKDEGLEVAKIIELSFAQDPKCPRCDSPALMRWGIF